ncbi:MAG: hypothetical protein Q4D33_12540, partial [Prevotellaceae bacterium]|nr:hypothetical protein [Prevotellaceae bacterium]
MRNNRQIRTILAVLLTVLMWLPNARLSQQVLAETDVWDGTLRRPIDGNGTKEDPILITSAEEFAFLMQNYDNASGVCFRKYYKLTCDINLNNKIWLYGTASTANRTFIAQFDGDGHKISNVRMMMAHSPRQVHVGLFPQLGGDAEFESVIENLHVENVTFEFYELNAEVTPSYQFRVGALVGQMYNNSRIENCIVSDVKADESFLQSNQPYNAQLWMAPLVGDTQEKFGQGAKYGIKVPSAKIENSYGHIDTDFAGISGANAESFKISKEQGKAVANKNSNSVSIVAIGDKNNTKYQAKLAKNGSYTYRWKFDNKELPSKTHSVQVPYLRHNETLSVEVLDNKGNVVAQDGIMVEVCDIDYRTTSVTKVAGGKSYNINAELVGPSKNELAQSLSYTWYDLTEDEK